MIRPKAANFPFAIVLLAGCRSFVPLSSGDGLDDFAQVLDSKWTVEDGVIASRQNPDGRLDGEGWLLTKKFYTDFVLKLKFRITPGGNSGVFLRTPVSCEERLAAPLGGPPPWAAGYEVNINNDEPVYPTGSVWQVASGRRHLQREEEWNDLEVKIVGERIWTWVNGESAIDGDMLDSRSPTGAIGFQRHGGERYRDKLIEFRDISILEL